jgi:hypothetical protein
MGAGIEFYFQVFVKELRNRLAIACGTIAVAVLGVVAVNLLATSLYPPTTRLSRRRHPCIASIFTRWNTQPQCLNCGSRFS